MDVGDPTVTYRAVYSSIGPLQSRSVWLGSTEDHAVTVDKPARIRDASQTALCKSARTHQQYGKGSYFAIKCTSGIASTPARPGVPGHRIIVYHLCVYGHFHTELYSIHCTSNCDVKHLASSVYMHAGYTPVCAWLLFRKRMGVNPNMGLYLKLHGNTVADVRQPQER